MGDYFHMVSDSNGASLAWAATFNNEQDVYYSYILTDIVPVELISFSSSVEGNTVNLSWQTATEINNHGFEIERASSLSVPTPGGTTLSQDWRTIGFVEGNGTTSEPQQYFYSDRLTDIATSKLFYRLKQVDFDGSFEYSKILEAEIALSVFSLEQNYPNPFNPSTIISWQSPVSSYQTLKVFDILGNEVATLVDEFKPAGKYEVEFDASEIPSGVYFYQLKTENFIETKKMILLR
jgi:hypothetical protein